VRACEDEQIVLTTYGRSSGFCVDPIEKKPLNHFLPGTPVLSFGTAGCNLGCKFCQNWDISKSREIDTLADQATPETIAFAAKDLNCRSVAFTYNDPVIFLEYAIDVANACHDQGIKTVAVTAGEICDEPRAEFFRAIDATNVDLKGFTDRFYRDVCAGHLQAVLDTLVYLKKETDVWLELTTLLIPGENDSEKELDEMTAWVVENLGPDVPMHFSAFHPDFRMTDKPRTPVETLQRARNIAKKNGVRYAYTGNVHDAATQCTYCHECGNLLIGRDWYVLSEWNLTDEGNCVSCGMRCSGMFDGPPGKWGSKRLPVRLKDYARISEKKTEPHSEEDKKVMSSIRQPAVAGRFYPADAEELKKMVKGYLEQESHAGGTPKALIVPHAGYVFSGRTAGIGYGEIAAIKETVTRVVLLGPAHYVRVEGIAASSCDAFETPLGKIPLDREAIYSVLELPQVAIHDEAHLPEHSLEVHLPFLQEMLGEFTLVPLVVGQASFDEVAEVLEKLWGGMETLIVISSDLSHYHDYMTARNIDMETSEAIRNMQIEKLSGDRACGYKGIGGLLAVAKQRGMNARIIDVRNSGDTSGALDRVVGYGAYAVE